MPTARFDAWRGNFAHALNAVSSQPKMTAVTAASPGSPLRITCNPDTTSGSAFDVKLIALPVG